MSLKKEVADRIALTRRTDILNAAIDLFDMKGYRNTTISQIAERANISKGLVYHYFNSKLDILKATTDIVAEAIDYLEKQNTLAEAIYENLFRLCYPASKTHFYPPLRAMYAAAVENSISREDFINSDTEHIYVKNLGARVFEKCVIDAQDRGEIGEGDPRKLSELLWSHSLGMMLQVRYAGQDLDLRESTDFLMSLLPKPV